ncbi:Adenylate kinase domain-containing protein [Rozella allomycis CSF55]|uniref:Adenylate kinase domain-containing protein n=1 Tax=Rozella allomycis (strain CSF55) TaxID=988480 RepID=A0A075B0E9_ROZAC|nr:Adenylate kinase domain-containing protein [Rozella allomycis CSF55]|eukprot:EPZ35855.1 Adenylate kinase domain-containing protein [Rozella allomycis CSF55]
MPKEPTALEILSSHSPLHTTQLILDDCYLPSLSLIADPKLPFSLHNFFNLSTLSLEGCSLSSLLGLPKLLKLKHLNVAFNELKSIAGIEKCTALVEVDLRGNPLDDICIDILADLPLLISVAIEDTGINESKLVESIPTIVEINGKEVSNSQSFDGEDSDDFELVKSNGKRSGKRGKRGPINSKMQNGKRPSKGKKGRSKFGSVGGLQEVDDQDHDESQTYSESSAAEEEEEGITYGKRPSKKAPAIDLENSGNIYEEDDDEDYHEEGDDNEENPDEVDSEVAPDGYDSYNDFLTPFSRKINRFFDENVETPSSFPSLGGQREYLLSPLATLDTPFMNKKQARQNDDLTLLNAENSFYNVNSQQESDTVNFEKNFYDFYGSHEDEDRYLNKQMNPSRKPFIIIHSKASPDLDKVTKLLEKEYALKVLNVENAFNFSASKAKDKIMELMYCGEACDPLSALELLCETLTSDETIFQGTHIIAIKRGCVLYNLESLCINSDMMGVIKDKFGCIFNKLQEYQVEPLFCEIEFEDSDITESRTILYFDHVTSSQYTEEEVQYAKKYFAQKKRNSNIEDDDDETDENEKKEDSILQNEEDDEDIDLESVKSDEDGDEQEEMENERDNDEDEENDGEEGKKIKMKKPKMTFDVLERLVKDPLNFNHNISKELESIIPISNSICIDGSQTVEEIFGCIDDFLNRLNLVPPVCRPKQLVVEEDREIFDDMAKEDVVTKHLSVDGDALSSPKKTLGKFKIYCPVTFATSGILTEGKNSLAVLYQNQVYYMSDIDAFNKFTVFPDKYLIANPLKRDFRLVITGSPLSGKSHLAQAISKIYNIDLIDYKTLLDNEKCQEEIDENDLISYIKEKSLTSFIIDGFIVDANQLKIFTEQQNIDHLIFIQSDEIDSKPVNVFSLKHNKLIKREINDTNPLLFREFKQFKEAIEEPKGLFETPEKEFYQQLNEKIVSQIDSFKEILSTSFSVLKAEKKLQMLLHSVRKAFDVLTPIPANILLDEGALNNPNLHFGFTKDFCVVSFIERNVLIKGDLTLAVLYKNKIYLMCTKEKMEAFMNSPEYYTNFDESIQIPKTRIVCIGPTKSGKTEILHRISKIAETPIINYNQYLAEKRTEFSDQNDINTINSFMKGEVEFLPEKMFQRLMDDLFSKSFLIEGFPKTRKEAEMLDHFGYQPDALIDVKLNNEAIYIKRNFNSHFESLKLRIEKSKEMDQGQEKDIENVGDFAISELKNIYEKECEQQEEIVEYLKSAMKMPVVSVEAERALRISEFKIKSKLNNYLQGRESIFCNAIPLTKKNAKSLLNNGFVQTSSFGKYCPVEYFRDGFFCHSSIGERMFVVDRKLYSVKSKAQAKNPLKYINQKSASSKSPPSAFILGPPKSGKTTMANRLEQRFGFVNLSVNKILDRILAKENRCFLKSQLLDSMCSGGTVPLPLLMQCLKSVLRQRDCLSKGWILEGFPEEESELNELENEGILPSCVLLLTCNLETSLNRSSNDILSFQEALLKKNIQYDICLESKAEIEKRYQKYEKNECYIKETYDYGRSITFYVDSTQSKWKVYDTLAGFVSNSIRKRQEFIHTRNNNKPACILNCGVHHDYVESHQSKFKLYCPVHFVDHNKLLLFDSYNENLIVEFNDLYYFLGGEGCKEKFINNPQYYATNEKNIPEDVPLRKKFTFFQKPPELAFRGYCPVTFKNYGSKFESIVKGELLHCVEYKGNTYAFINAAAQDEFMQQPWEYVDLKLPHKLPPPIVGIDVKGLPTLGYIEQNLGDMINKALVSVGSIRPKHPSKTLDQSAIEFLAMYLKGTSYRSL